MRRIVKGQEPTALTTYRSRGKTKLDNDAPRQDIREALCREQRFLCAFCQSRLKPDPDHMKIAHVVPQGTTQGANLGTTWINLVGACMGGEGHPPKDYHCDKRQQNTLLPDRLHPVLMQSDAITFNAKAELLSRSVDSAVNDAIQNTLGLNIWKLRNLREHTAKALAYVLQGKSPEAVDDTIERLEDPNASELQVCVDYLLFRLKQRKAALQSCM